MVDVAPPASHTRERCGQVSGRAPISAEFGCLTSSDMHLKIDLNAKRKMFDL